MMLRQVVVSMVKTKDCICFIPYANIFWGDCKSKYQEKRCFKNVKGQNLPILKQVKKIQNIKLLKILLY